MCLDRLVSNPKAGSWLPYLPRTVPWEQACSGAGWPLEPHESFATPILDRCPFQKALAGHRAIFLTALILTANSPENTRKMATLPEACQCASVLRRRYRFWRCCNVNDIQPAP